MYKRQPFVASRFRPSPALFPSQFFSFSFYNLCYVFHFPLVSTHFSLPQAHLSAHEFPSLIFGSPFSLVCCWRLSRNGNVADACICVHSVTLVLNAMADAHIAIQWFVGIPSGNFSQLWIVHDPNVRLLSDDSNWKSLIFWIITGEKEKKMRKSFKIRLGTLVGFLFCFVEFFVCFRLRECSIFDAFLSVLPIFFSLFYCLLYNCSISLK